MAMLYTDLKKIPTETISELLREAAAAAIMPRFSPNGCESIEKSDGSPVTLADTDAERIITSTLKKLSPGSMILGEEAAAHLSASEAQKLAAECAHGWTVDPLDGTKAFAKGSPYFAVMVSEFEWGMPKRGWIHLPMFNETFTGGYSEMPKLNGRPILVPPTPKTSFRGVSYETPKSPNHDGFISGRGSGSVGVDYTHLLRGYIDFVGHREPKPWDHFPGRAIISNTTVMTEMINSKIVIANGHKARAAALQNLHTNSGALGYSPMPACRCRLGTFFIDPQCGVHA